MTRPATAIAEPNITPLIDVLLVLLIIFMLVVPVSPRGLDAALPESERRDAGRVPAPALVVVLDPSGVRLDGTPYGSLEQLQGHLRDVLDARTDKTVLVHALGGVSYGAVVEVMDGVRGSGAERIGLVTQPTEAPEPSGS
jgi:biopolymer transport protein TolR